jgi:biotin operon repressor
LAGGDANTYQVMSGPVTELRAALPAATSGEPANRRPTRDTKQSQILAMLSRAEGASGPQIAEATGWASHTVRGFLAGLGKKGVRVEVLDRFRQIRWRSATDTRPRPTPPKPVSLFPGRSHRRRLRTTTAIFCRRRT